MIATVVFFAEECMFEGMLVSDVWVAVMHEGAREVFVRTGTWFEVVEFVGCERGSSQEGAEKARLFGRIQDRC